MVHDADRVSQATRHRRKHDHTSNCHSNAPPSRPSTTARTSSSGVRRRSLRSVGVGMLGVGTLVNGAPVETGSAMVRTVETTPTGTPSGFGPSIVAVPRVNSTVATDVPPYGTARTSYEAYPTNTTTYGQPPPTQSQGPTEGGDSGRSGGAAFGAVAGGMVGLFGAACVGPKVIDYVYDRPKHGRSDGSHHGER